MQHFVFWIVVGLLAGMFVKSFVAGERLGGTAGDLMTGTAGAVMGGLPCFFLLSGTWIASTVGSVGGAALFLYLFSKYFTAERVR